MKDEARITRSNKSKRCAIASSFSSSSSSPSYVIVQLLSPCLMLLVFSISLRTVKMVVFVDCFHLYMNGNYLRRRYVSHYQTHPKRHTSWHTRLMGTLAYGHTISLRSPTRTRRRRRKAFQSSPNQYGSNHSFNDDGEGKDSTSSPSALQAVRIFDNVFDAGTCEELHYLALEHGQRSKRGNVFQRTKPNKTPLEQALNSYLDNIGDDQPIVEYWTRNEFLHMEAHADLDEDVFEATSHRIQCPTFGHVLYLGIQPGLRGPTCVFTNKLGGWTTTTPTTDSGTSKVSMVAVPAVQGRVLRFPGSAVHAVPKPAGRWIVNNVNVHQEVSSDDDETVDSITEDDDSTCDDEDLDDIERSVVLFNTWSSPGPKGVPNDDAVFQNPYETQLPEGMIAVDDDDGDEINMKYSDDINEYAERVMEQWEEEYGPNCEDLHCRPMTRWTPVEFALIGGTAVSDGSGPTTIKIPLMGRRARRLHPTKHAELTTYLEKETLQAALEDPKVPCILELVEE